MSARLAVAQRRTGNARPWIPADPRTRRWITDCWAERTDSFCPKRIGTGVRGVHRENYPVRAWRHEAMAFLRRLSGVDDADGEPAVGMPRIAAAVASFAEPCGSRSTLYVSEEVPRLVQGPHQVVPLGVHVGGDVVRDLAGRVAQSDSLPRRSRIRPKPDGHPDRLCPFCQNRTWWRRGWVAARRAARRPGLPCGRRARGC